MTMSAKLAPIQIGVAQLYTNDESNATSPASRKMRASSSSDQARRD